MFFDRLDENFEISKPRMVKKIVLPLGMTRRDQKAFKLDQKSGMP